MGRGGKALEPAVLLSKADSCRHLRFVSKLRAHIVRTRYYRLCPPMATVRMGLRADKKVAVSDPRPLADVDGSRRDI